MLIRKEVNLDDMSTVMKKKLPSLFRQDNTHNNLLSYWVAELNMFCNELIYKRLKT